MFHGKLWEAITNLTNAATASRLRTDTLQEMTEAAIETQKKLSEYLDELNTRQATTYRMCAELRAELNTLKEAHDTRLTALEPKKPSVKNIKMAPRRKS